ncbi:response regulator transcription factor [Arthrobacter sp. ATA002]|uniref:response regulator n=1 Tax=Arthrobacter sp. ATA002 TaxID=2991715 RepID=UPI0022A6BDEB|nr:response regulator transcription factor [Arthrobacter sp. ATA002]WAP53087.1 response regulator transcription factor [Arthrobacter sp. ATA002]
MTGPAEAPLRILLADDHAAIRTGLRMILETAGGFDIAGEAADGATAVTMARALRPDVTLMDIRMPGTDGIAATTQIVTEALSAVLVLTTFDLDDYVFGALRAGAAGFVLKSVEPAELVRAVRSLAGGDSVLSPEVTGTLIAAFVAGPRPPVPGSAVPGSADAAAGPGLPGEALTAREEAVLACLGEGLSNRQIARRLAIAETTVKTHVSRVLAKLGVQSRVQAAIAFRERGGA